jgi:hypothetical protein
LAGSSFTQTMLAGRGSLAVFFFFGGAAASWLQAAKGMANRIPIQVNAYFMAGTVADPSASAESKKPFSLSKICC